METVYDGQFFSSYYEQLSSCLNGDDGLWSSAIRQRLKREDE